MIKLKNVEKNKVIAVALSGGKDSMCLLSLLLSVKDNLNLTVKAINVDHSIRGEESKNDSLFVENYCRKLGVPLYFKKVDAVKFSKENKLTIEQGARILRYSIFDDAIKSGFCDKVATAHHLNDNFESVLLNMFRGTGLKGISGISETNGDIIRPLLSVSRNEIDEYILSNEIPFVEDSTNACSDYSRNYIRNEITPKIIEKFDNAPNAVLRLSKIVKEEDEFLNSLAKNAIIFNGDHFKILANTNKVIFYRAVILILKELGLDKDYEKVHIDRIYSLCNKQSGKISTIKKNLVAYKEYDYIVIKKQNEKTENKEVNFTLGEINFLNKKLIITKTKLDGGLYFDLDKIPKNAVIRTRKNGDFFTKFSSGTKKLKEFFIDKKIPLKDRNTLPLLAVDNEILIVFGIEISNLIKVDSSTKNIAYALIENDLIQ